MTTRIQIRNVPDDLHRALKSRAALAGKSLSEYLLGEIREVARRPTNEEIKERLRNVPPIDLGMESVEIIREYRDRE